MFYLIASALYQVPHFVRPGETLASSEMQTFPGGKGLNQSVALGRAGATVIHGGFIGNNDKWLADILEASKVDIRHLQTVSMPSGHAIIQVDTNGQNCILLFADANHCFTLEYLEKALADAESGDILLLQNEICPFDTGKRRFFTGILHCSFQRRYFLSYFKHSLYTRSTFAEKILSTCPAVNPPFSRPS